MEAEAVSAELQNADELLWSGKLVLLCADSRTSNTTNWKHQDLPGDCRSSKVHISERSAQQLVLGPKPSSYNC
jgi:hypothetical protein